MFATFQALVVAVAAVAVADYLDSPVTEAAVEPRAKAAVSGTGTTERYDASSWHLSHTDPVMSVRALVLFIAL